MTITIEITGVKELQRRFAFIQERVDAAVRDEIAAAGLLVATHAKVSLRGEGKTGRVYTWRGAKPGEKADFFIRAPQGHVFPAKKRATPHRASAPGEAPASDFGELMAGIVHKIEGGGFVATVMSRAPHSKHLEFGTRFMGGARPFLQPALFRNEKRIARNIADAIRRAIVVAARS